MDHKSPTWPGILAGLLIFSLLLAFHQVVRGAVEQGAVRQKATALYNEGVLHCNSLRDPGASGSCLSQLRAQPDDNAETPILNDQGVMISKLDPIWNK